MVIDQKSLITNLVEKKVGEVSHVETALQGVRNFVHGRVNTNVRKPLGTEIWCT
jgi:hypothetical protein